MTNILFLGADAPWADYAEPLRRAFATLPFEMHLSRDIAPDKADYLVMGGGEKPPEDFSIFTNAKALLRLWAGVEDIVTNETLTIPVARMVGGGLDRGMVEWVVGHTLRHHLGMDTYIDGSDWTWRDTETPPEPPLARDRPVTILGLGALGRACGEALSALGFPVTGWSRSAKEVSGIRCLHGQDGLIAALTDAQVVILLLPKTHATENTMNAATFALLAPGAFILNPGRGHLIDDDALLAALETGQVGHATLDTYRVEPLPEDHPFWAHPRVTVTPHIASTTRPDLAAEVIAENIRRGEAGEPFINLVDRAAGY